MIKIILKFVFALGLIYWLVQSGELDFSLLFNSFKHPVRWIFCLALFVLQIFCSTLRWKYLLELKSQEKFPFLKILKLTWIGNLFNTALPGVVSGDFIKLFYAKDIHKAFSKTFLITSVMMDRILGLVGLILLLGITCLLNFKQLISLSPQVANLIKFNFILFIGMILFLFSIFLHTKPKNKILDIAKKLPFVGNHLHNTLTQVWLIGENKKLVIALSGLSLISQTINVLAFWYLAVPYFHIEGDVSLSLFQAFSFIPIGFLVIAIPITPSGLGLGHVIFDSLFGYFGVGNGASLFNLYFVAWVSTNLLGIFAYLSSDTKKVPRNLSDLEKLP